MLEQSINQAVEILKQGGLVGMPTETVYGLAADATNPEALQKIFQAKQRPIDHPLIVHIADKGQLSQWVSDIPPMAWLLMEAFWPGPMTLILPKAHHVSDLITAGQKTIGIRIPRHPIAQTLLKKFGGAVAAPSANRFGHLSPTTAEAVREELGNAVDLVLEGGQCEVGLESTIIDVSREPPRILRPGMITAADIESVLHAKLGVIDKSAPRVSGSLASHYAPMTPVEIIKPEDFPNVDFPSAFVVRNSFVMQKANVEVILMSDDPKTYAHDIYQTLRDLDKKGYKKIFIAAIPEGRAWDAVRDRLSRAAKL